MADQDERGGNGGAVGFTGGAATAAKESPEESRISLGQLPVLPNQRVSSIVGIFHTSSRYTL